MDEMGVVMSDRRDDDIVIREPRDVITVVTAANRIVIYPTGRIEVEPRVE